MARVFALDNDCSDCDTGITLRASTFVVLSHISRRNRSGIDHTSHSDWIYLLRGLFPCALHERLAEVRTVDSECGGLRLDVFIYVTMA